MHENSIGGDEPPTSQPAERYPKRDSHFAHRFVRELGNACAAQDIGPEACWLLTVVAHQEDAKRYSGPVTYYNEQLMPLCGFASKGLLVRARNRAVEAGWLHYQQGGKSKPGIYWVKIPEAELSFQNGTETDVLPVQNGTRSGRQPDGNRTANGRQTDGKRTANAPLPTLYPNPNPDPDPKDKGRKRPTRFVPPTVEEVASYCKEERGNKVDPEYFVAFYAKQGWKLSNGVAMKDWRACVVTWEKNAGDRATKQSAADPRGVMAAREMFIEMEASGNV